MTEIMPKTRGFTLVELSIVLVIIGLLVAGILVAQSMTDTARAQRITLELQQYQIMVDNFGTKYNALPSDDAMFALPVIMTVWSGMD